MNKNKRPFIAVRTIILNPDGKALILRRSNTKLGNGKWCLPGGNIEYGQKVEEAVETEVKQETSLVIKSLRFLFYLENMQSEESDLHYVNLVFICDVNGKLKINHESSDYAWIGPDEIGNYEIAFGNDTILSKYWNSDY